VVEGDGPRREDVVGLDSSIILPRQVWVASGHVGTFTDPLVECLSATSGSPRADHLQEAYAAKKGGGHEPRRRS
jgi:glycyl-tRNA synthetase